MLHVDSDLTPFSPRAELLARRAELVDLRRRHPDPADQAAIAEELARVDGYLAQSPRDRRESGEP